MHCKARTTKPEYELCMQEPDPNATEHPGRYVVNVFKKVQKSHRDKVGGRITIRKKTFFYHHFNNEFKATLKCAWLIEQESLQTALICYIIILW